MNAAQGAPAAEADPEIAAARQALRIGDFGAARRTLLRLRAAAPKEETRRAADELLERLRPDPAAIVLLVLCLVGFVVVILVTR
jgi:hypothetical protein